MSFGTPYSLGFASSSANANTVALTTALDVQVDDIMVALIYYANTSQSINSVTDTVDGADATDWAGNTQLATASGRVRMFWKKASTALPSGSTITASFGVVGTSVKNILVVAFSGGNTIDKSLTGNTATGAAPSIALGTLAENDEIVLLALRADGATTTTDPAGYTFIASSAATRVAYRVVTSNAADTPAFAITSGSVVYGIQAMSFTLLGGVIGISALSLTGVG